MKNIGFLTLVILTTVLLTLAFTAAASPKTTAPVAVAAVPAAALAAMPAEHPEIHAALEAMHNAKDHLEHAAHDFDGHRVESIKHLDAAIHEAEICERMP